MVFDMMRNCNVFKSISFLIKNQNKNIQVEKKKKSLVEFFYCVIDTVACVKITNAENQNFTRRMV